MSECCCSLAESFSLEKRKAYGNGKCNRLNRGGRQTGGGSREDSQAGNSKNISNVNRVKIESNFVENTVFLLPKNITIMVN